MLALDGRPELVTRSDVTEAESELLETLWRCGDLTPPRLFAEVKQRQNWGDSTVKTLLSRLMRKKMVQSERINGRLLYRPLLERDTYLAGLVDSLVDRAFGGDCNALESFLKRRRSAGRS